MTIAPSRPLAQKAAGRLVWAREKARRVREQRLGLLARLAALEAEVQESRHLNRRIAELADVVGELLVPLHARDEERVAEVLEAYRRSI
ncbi:DUF6752 domain-containing protein [Nocardioides jishulii]|uniref:DUF6752 domain-containing protein n=1 Tax=Nocardioides jishulii TaxID=2575440 RepID=A0A4U2YHD7_9ACTN|nr:DUF6752 domain-containing protein [Nocardioides jishulii]QCX26632.1 hypothetical protein FCL41_03020 [Nocardioides jishulii]TKI60399.1 hypothetical protein FC770_16530 [Nocardioides jishulii]